MTLPIGLGVYPSSTLADIDLALPRIGRNQVLVMSTPTESRHNLATEMMLRGHRVTRRAWLPDPQLDWNQTPDSEARRWFGVILDGMTPAAFRAIYTRAVGPNECYGDVTKFAWLAAFELALCRLLKAVGIAYAWGSIASGNVDPIPFATTFAGILAEAESTCYHLYAEPYQQTLEPASTPWWARRPWDWFTECKKRGVRFPPLFAGESGTHYPWHPATSSAVYVALLGQISDLLATWRAAGMPVLGQCVFALGAEGTMGQQWNLDRDALQRIGAWNGRADVDYSEPKEATMTDYAPALWVPSTNYGYPRGTAGRNGESIIAIVDHIEAGSEVATDAEFQNNASNVSSTYSVRLDGSVHQYVRESDAAWANGIDFAAGYAAYKSNLTVPWIQDCWNRQISPNLRVISIEHEGQTGQPMPEAQYQGSLALKRDILARNPSMPRTVLALLGHHDIDDVTRHFCPGTGNDRARFLADLGLEDALTAQQKAAVLDDLGMIWGMSNADTIKVNPAESDRAIKERVVAIKVALGINK